MFLAPLRLIRRDAGTALGRPERFPMPFIGMENYGARRRPLELRSHRQGAAAIPVAANTTPTAPAPRVMPVLGSFGNIVENEFAARNAQKPVGQIQAITKTQAMIFDNDPT